MTEENGHFKLIQKTNFNDINDNLKVKESDLCFQDENHIYQFKYVEPEIEYREKIKPGVYSLITQGNYITTKKTELRTRKLLSSVVNSKLITDESNLFFDNLDVYEELNKPKARKILMHSDPGMGKTATITQYCQDAIVADPGTVVLVWPTAEIDSTDVSKFLSKFSIYEKECTRMILIMEDIGGGEREGHHGSRSVDSAMLDILDGLQVTFKLPTLILATTNYPQNLLSALADRPGRFDLILKLNPPLFEEQVKLIEFIGNKDLDDRAKSALKEFGKDFSIAHLDEIVIRSRLRKVHIAETIEEIRKHRDLFNNDFEENNEVGFKGW